MEEITKAPHLPAFFALACFHAAHIKQVCQPFRSADISVSLCNKGEDAYKRDVYGDTITVERRLSADGGGGYKIKNAVGK